MIDAQTQVAPSRLDVATPAEKNTFRPIVELGKGKPLEGNVFYTPHAEIYSDLHGVGNLDKAAGLIVINGDVPDRGKDSWRRMQDVKKRVEQGNAVYGLGNHEAFILSAMTDDPSGANRDKLSLLNWLANGGNETAEGAGIKMQELNDKITDSIKRSGGDPNVANSQDKMRRVFLSAWYQTIIGGAPKPGSSDYTNRLAKYNKAIVEVGNLQAEFRQNQGLKECADFLRQRQLYEVVNNEFSTHAGFAVDTNGNLLQVGRYGTGIEALDNIQSALRVGDPEAVHFLASDESPLDVRETWLKAISDPQIAHRVRAQINAQLAVATANRPACRAEQLTFGHTPTGEVQRLGFQNVGKTTATATPVDRIVFADYGAAYGGRQGMMKVDMDAGGNVSSVLVDAETGQPLKATTGNEVKASWKIDGIAQTARTGVPTETRPSSVFDPNVLKRIDPANTTDKDTQDWLGEMRKRDWKKPGAAVEERNRLDALAERFRLQDGAKADRIKGYWNNSRIGAITYAILVEKVAGRGIHIASKDRKAIQQGVINLIKGCGLDDRSSDWDDTNVWGVVEAGVDRMLAFTPESQTQSGVTTLEQEREALAELDKLIGNPDDYREKIREPELRKMLTFLVGSNAVGMIHREINELRLGMVDGTIPEKKGQLRINRLLKMADVARGEAAKIDEQVEEFIDKSDDPEKKSFGLDIKKHFLTREKIQLESERARMGAEGESTEIIDRRMQIIDGRLEKVKTQREQVEAKAGKTFLDLLAGQAVTIVDKISGGHLSSTRKLEIAKDPIGEMVKAFGDLHDNPEKFQALRGEFETILGKEGAVAFERALTFKDEEDTAVRNERMGLARNIGLGSIGIIGLFIYLAYMMEQKKGAAGGG